MIITLLYVVVVHTLLLLVAFTCCIEILSRKCVWNNICVFLWKHLNSSIFWHCCLMYACLAFKRASVFSSCSTCSNCCLFFFLRRSCCCQELSSCCTDIFLKLCKELLFICTLALVQSPSLHAGRVCVLRRVPTTLSCPSRLQSRQIFFSALTQTWFKWFLKAAVCGLWHRKLYHDSSIFFQFLFLLLPFTVDSIYFQGFQLCVCVDPKCKSTVTLYLCSCAMRGWRALSYRVGLGIPMVSGQEFHNIKIKSELRM